MRTPLNAALRLVIAVAAGAGTAPPMTAAQPQLNPVYVDDSPGAADTLARVKDHVAASNLDEAVRVLQALLDQHADRLTPSADDPDVFIAVRARAHQVILENPALLGRYRALLGPRAAAELAAGGADAVTKVERTLLLTPAGMEAALRLAQAQAESARFETARLTLEQLEAHPDRLTAPAEPGVAAHSGRDAAAMLATVASYLDRPEVWIRSERWATQAGAPAPGPREGRPWPEAATMCGQSPLDQLPELSTDGLISKPLWTITLQAPNPAALELPAGLGVGGGGRGAGNIPANARTLEMLPTVCGDLLVVNDGSVISAWDRFTLSPRWTVQPSGPQPAVRGGNDDRDGFGFRARQYTWNGVSGTDPLTVTIDGRYGAVATGRAAGNGRDGDNRVHGLDARTGRVRWSRSLAEIDPGLSDSSIRGPMDIDEGVTVLAARKHSPDRRLLSLTLVGLDAESGQTLWQRPIGSAGWLPFGSQSFGPEGSVVDQGVVYRTDRLGVAAAVEAGSGRPVWVRRLPAEAGASPPGDPQPWEINRPVIDGASIIIIAPDQARIVRLDRATGKVLGECPATKLGQPVPAYLLRVGTHLAAIPGVNATPNRITFVPIAAFEADPAASTRAFESPGVWGRVSVVGEKLLVPIVGGLALVDPQAPAAAPLIQPLDEPGNILAIGRQLLVVDDSRAHSYLQWETADSILTERMTADPKDPTPAVTFTELAYRAGRPERLAASVDSAIAAIALEPETERNQTARARLFEALHGIVNSGLEPAEERVAAESIPARGHGAEAPRITDPALLALLVDRLGKSAETPDDRVAVALAGGRLAEGDGAEPGAIKAAGLYQTVLDDQDLATANWRGASVSVRAELEVTRRLEGLIAKYGPQVYAAQEDESRRTLDALGEGATPEKLDALVGRFPLATSTPEAYLRLHTLIKAAAAVGGGDGRSAVSALELGLKAAQRIHNPPAPAVGELAGRLITELRARKQTAAAAGALRTAARRFPGIALTTEGQTLDAAQIEGELQRTIAANTRWPRIGPATSANTQALSNVAIMRPVLRDNAPHVASCLVLEGEREVAVWAVAGPEAKAPGELARLWQRTIDESGATLIRADRDAVYILARGTRSGGIEKVPVGPDAGKPGAPAGWKTESLTRLFPPDARTRGMNRVAGIMADHFETPDDGLVPSDDLIVAMDERTLALVQRGGRVVAIDTDTGAVLWSGATPVSRVYDAQLVGGVLVVGGDAGRADPSGAMVDAAPTVQVMDARTGRMGQSIGDIGGRVRWVRITDEGALICGLENAVISFDLTTSQRNWTITNADVMPAAAAWVFGDRLLMMSTDRSLWLASVSTGRLGSRALETPRTHIDSTRELEAYLTTGNPDGPFAVSTQQGVMIFGPSGELQGTDGLGGIEAMLTPRPAEDRVVAVETVSDGRNADGLMRFGLHGMESGGGMLVDSRPLLLGARPMEVELLDGKIAVTAGAVTVVIDAPGRK